MIPNGWPPQRQLLFYASLDEASGRCTYHLIRSGLVFETCLWEGNPLLIISSHSEINGGVKIEDWVTSMRYLIDAYEWQ
jgi:hypothetical protein